MTLICSISKKCGKLPPPKVGYTCLAKLIGKVRFDGLPKLEDLRKMSEEQFVEAFEMLRGRTSDWSEFSARLFEETPQLLFVARIGLGLSQLEFARKLGVDKQWVRHFESGRQGFKKSLVIPRLIDLLDREFSSSIDIQKAIKALKACHLARERSLVEFPQSTIKLKRTFEMEPKDFQESFLILKERTKDFTEFDESILVEIPQFISIFRIVLGMGIIKFSKVVGLDDAHIRRWESMKERISFSTAQDLIKKIEELFKKQGLIGSVSVDSAIKSFEEFCFF